MMTNIIVIGGNHGLGLEWVKYYLDQGHSVTATFRDKEASEELFAIEKENDKLTTIECDVTNLAHIEALANKTDPADIYIYNAGTKGYTRKFIKPIDNTTQELELALKVNCIGLDAVIRAFFLKIIAHPNCLFVYMSTGVSSTLDNAGGDYLPYRISKAAGNSCIRDWDIYATEQWLEKGKDLDLRPLLFALTPGMVDIGMAAGVPGAMPVNQAISNMIKVMTEVLSSKDSHALWSHSGSKIESYVMPTLIVKHQAQQVQNKQEMEEQPARTYLPMLENQVTTAIPTAVDGLNEITTSKKQTVISPAISRLI